MLFPPPNRAIEINRVPAELNAEPARADSTAPLAATSPPIFPPRSSPCSAPEQPVLVPCYSSTRHSAPPSRARPPSSRVASVLNLLSAPGEKAICAVPLLRKKPALSQHDAQRHFGTRLFRNRSANTALCSISWQQARRQPASQLCSRARHVTRFDCKRRGSWRETRERITHGALTIGFGVVLG